MRTKRTICLLCVITMLLQLAMPLLSFAANKSELPNALNNPSAHWRYNEGFGLSNQDCISMLNTLKVINRNGSISFDRSNENSEYDINTKERINKLLSVKYNKDMQFSDTKGTEWCIVRSSTKGNEKFYSRTTTTTNSMRNGVVIPNEYLVSQLGIKESGGRYGILDAILFNTSNNQYYFIQVAGTEKKDTSFTFAIRDITDLCTGGYDIPEDIIEFGANKEASDLKSAQSRQAQYNPSKGDSVAKLYNHMKNTDSALEPNERTEMVQSNQYRELIIMDNIYRYAGVLNISQKYFTAETLTPDTTGNNLDILAVANEVALSYDDMVTSISGHSPENTAYLFDTLVKYQMGRVTGAQEQNVEDGIMADKLIYSDDLNDILPATSEIKGRVFNPEIFSALSSKKVKPHSYSLHEYEKLAVLLQDIEDYSIEVTQDDSTLTKYITEDCKKNEDGTMNYPPIKDGDLIRKIKSYVAIKNGLAYLGINPWIDTLQKIVQTVDKYHLDEIVAQEDFNDYDTNADKEPLRAFFDVSRSVLSPNYLMGIALSSTFIPLHSTLGITYRCFRFSLLLHVNLADMTTTPGHLLER